MKKVILLACLAIALMGCAQTESFKNGDIIFQSSKSGQSLAVQLATHSKYSHVGVLMKEGDEWYVYEAVQPVKKTKFEKWIKHGDDKFWITKRLEGLTSEQASKIKSYMVSQLNKNYDTYYNWGDGEMYCSELVWKAYHAVGIDLCDLRKMSSFDLTHPIVKVKLQERYGTNIPLDEKVVAPSDIFDSVLLKDGALSN